VMGCVAAGILLANTAADDESSKPAFVAQVAEGVTVELLGIATGEKDSQWWNADGTSVAAAPFDKLSISSAFEPPGRDCRSVAVRIRGQGHEGRRTVFLDGAKQWVAASRGSDSVFESILTSEPLADLSTGTIRVAFGKGDWGPIQQVTSNGEKIPADLPGELRGWYDFITAKAVEEVGDQTRIRLGPFDRSKRRHTVEWTAIDSAGISLVGKNGVDNREMFISFDTPLSDVDHFEFRLLPYRHWATFENVSLQRGKKTDVKISVGNIPAPPPDRYVAKLPGGHSVELVGLKEMEPGLKWWKADGRSMESVVLDKSHGRVLDPHAICQALLYVRGPKSIMDVTNNHSAMRLETTFPDGTRGVRYHMLVTPNAPSSSSGTIRIGVATVPLSPWRRLNAKGQKMPAVPPDLEDWIADDIVVESVDHPTLEQRFVAGKPVSVPPDAQQRNAKSLQQTQLTWKLETLQDETIDLEMKLIDVDGKPHQNTGLVGFENSTKRGAFIFDVPVDRVSRFEYRMRPYQHWITFENVSLQPGKRTNVKVAVKSAPASLPDIYVAQLPDGRSVEFVGITKNTRPASEGWKPDGRVLGDEVGEWPKGSALHGVSDAGSLSKLTPPVHNARDFLFRFRGLKSQPSLKFQLPVGSIGYPALPLQEPYLLRVAGALRDKETSSNKAVDPPDDVVRVAISDDEWGEWLQVSLDGHEVLNPLKQNDLYRLDYESIVIEPMRQNDGAISGIALDHSQNSEWSEYHIQARGVDSSGDEHRVWTSIQSGGKSHQFKIQKSVIGRIPKGRTLSRFEFRLRPYRHLVTFENIVTEKPTDESSDVKITVKELRLPRDTIEVSE